MSGKAKDTKKSKNDQKNNDNVTSIEEAQNESTQWHESVQPDVEHKRQPESRLDKCLRNIPIIKWVRPTQPTIGVIRLSGVIAQEKGLMGTPGLSIDGLNDAIEQAFALRNLKAVILLINSPGGAPAQSEMIAKRIRQLAEEKEVPVITCVEDVAASGGYWLACAGDEIFASEGSIIGSIGVVSSMFGFVDAMKKMGVERRVYTQGENKNQLDPFLPEKESDVEMLHGLQKELHDVFIDMVKNRRKDKLNLQKHKDIFDGSFWTGRKALDRGLIDGIDTMHNVIHARYGDKVKVKMVNKEKSWLKRKLAASLSADSWVRAALGVVEERMAFGRFGL